MLKLTYKDYVIYFSSSCLVEPFHLHVNSPIPKKEGAAKLWISSDGRYKIARLGKFSEDELNRVYNKFIRNNLSAYITDWKNTNLEVIVFHEVFAEETSHF